MLAEIEALSEIYDNQIFSYNLNKESGELKGEFIAFTKLDGTSVTLSGNDSEYKILHLPPIYLKFTLNVNCAGSKPHLSLNSSWLPKRCLKVLDSKLIEIVQENDESIIWLCCEFLESEAIRIVSESNSADININLNDIFPLDSEDKIAENIKLLCDFNESQDDSLFKNLILECEVCCVMKRGNECSKFGTCSHNVCNACLMEHFNTRISLGFFNLSCAVCGEEIDYAEVRRVLDAQSFDRWDTLSFNSTVKTLDDHRACSRCQTFIPVNQEDGFGFCRKCRFTFCLDCNQVFNGPKCCHNITEEDVELNEQRRINRLMHTRKGRLEYARNLLKESEVEDQKYCPKCFLMFEKNGGCSHMTCPCCRTHFCYLCNKILSANDPYSHFSDKCQLFVTLS